MTKTQQLAVELRHVKTHSSRHHNFSRRELWNVQSRESSSTQAAINIGRPQVFAVSGLPQVIA